MLNRRAFVASFSVAALMARRGLAMPSLLTQRAFLGTTGKEAQGIFTADFDAKTGTFSEPQFAAKLQNTDFMALSPKNKRRLYATCVVDKVSAVTAFEITDDPVPLRQIDQQTARGTNSVYLSLDHTGRVAMDANWGSGLINTYPVDKDGRLQPAVEHIEYGDAHHGPRPNQIHSRAHSIVPSPDNRFVLVNDVGDDCIRIYRLEPETAKLTPHDPPLWQGAPGTMPRHLVFHPNGKWAYTNGEYDNTVSLLAWDAKAGTLKLLSTVPTLPAGHPTSYTSDLLLSPDGHHLYCSNRGADVVNVWAVGKDGALHSVQTRDGLGQENRQMTLDATGRWLIAANMHSNQLQVFPRDPRTGMLSDGKASITLGGVCFTLWA